MNTIKLRFYLSYILAVMLVLISGCATQNYDARTEIRGQWDKFVLAWEQEDADKLVAMYTEDGLNVPPGSKENKGRVQILEFYNMLFENNASSNYEHQINTLFYESNTAIEYGNFEVSWVRNDSSKWTYQARSTTHWVRSAEGNWQIKMFLFNNPPSED